MNKKKRQKTVDSKGMNALLWFRKDLRLTNNLALNFAKKYFTNTYAVYIFEEPSEYGGAQKVWLHHSLEKLNESIDKALIFKIGKSDEIIKSVCTELNIESVLVNKVPTPQQITQDIDIKNDLKSIGIEFKSFEGYTMFKPGLIKTGKGTDFKVFTPYFKACLNAKEPFHPFPKPQELTFSKISPGSTLKLDDLNLLPKKPDWSKELFDEFNWQPGEAGAISKLTSFVKTGLPKYATKRDFPAENPVATSLLSPHLHFGEVSPHQVWWVAKESKCDANTVKKFLAELVWREFSYYLLHFYPKFPTENWNSKFDEFPWNEDLSGLKKWQKGMTGYPIVDAGMRQLYATGYMHNRVRMIVASFLTKDLLIHWKYGAAWFWDTLFDADIASNAAGWQWTAGSGADASPYFRVFNPITQSKKFDSKGKYLRKWIPEISKLSDKDIHCPWEASTFALKGANIELGKTYPKPLVDHAKARKEALKRYEAVKVAPKTR